MNFSYERNCTDGNGAFVSVGSLDYTTPKVADSTPSWISVLRSTSISGGDLANGSSICLKWTSDDVSGADARDEFGNDNIEVRVSGPTALTTFRMVGKSSQKIQWLLLAGVVGILFLGSLILHRKTISPSFWFTHSLGEHPSIHLKRTMSGMIFECFEPL